MKAYLTRLASVKEMQTLSIAGKNPAIDQSKFVRAEVLTAQDSNTRAVLTNGHYSERTQVW
jgi:hypothetical protein